MTTSLNHGDIIMGQHMWNLMVTTNQKPIIETQQQQQKEPNHTRKKIIKIQREEVLNRGRTSKITEKQVIKWQ